MCAKLGALAADAGKETCDFLNDASAPVAADDTEEKPKIIVDLGHHRGASKELPRTPQSLLDD